MLFRRTLRPATLFLAAAGLSCLSLAAQTTENSSASTATSAPAVQPAPLPAVSSTVRGETLSRGGGQVAPVTGETKIHGSTVPRAMMPREESLGDAARRMRKHKRHYYGKKHAKRPASKKAAARQPFKQPQL